MYHILCATSRRPRPTMPRFGLSVAAATMDRRRINLSGKTTSVLPLTALINSKRSSPLLSCSSISAFDPYSEKADCFQTETSSSKKMTIFEYHSAMETGMKRITCSGTPHEVELDFLVQTLIGTMSLTFCTDRLTARIRGQAADIQMHRLLRRPFPGIGQKELARGARIGNHVRAHDPEELACVS